MLARLKAVIDLYIAALFGAVLLASVLPARGGFVPVVQAVTNAAIVFLFFLHGARLSREAILAGAGHARLHVAVLGTTFVVFPLLGLALAALPGITSGIGAGLLFLTLLPSTVQSSIAFTAIARGNVAAAVCSASFSNLLGIFVTPLLASLLMGRAGAGFSWDSAEKITLQLLLPFVGGHLLRPVVGRWVARHRRLVTAVDRGSILLVVYSAFGAAVLSGLWHEVPPASLLLIAVLTSLLLAVVLAFTRRLAKALSLTREDAIVLLFCGSKKSLASGVPIAGVLFAPAQVGLIVLPLMIFHQIQLIVCAALARRFARTAGPGTAPAG